MACDCPAPSVARRTGQSWSVEQKLYNELAGKPWDYGSGVIGTRFVPLPRTRKPNVPSLPEHPPGSGVGEVPGAAHEAPPEAEAKPAASEELAAFFPAPPSATAVLTIPPGVARAVPGPRSNMQELVEPNPALQPMPPATPDAMLPPLSPVPTMAAAHGSTSMDTGDGRAPRSSDEPQSPAKKLRLRAVQFGQQSYEVNDDLELDVDSEEYWCAESALWAATDEMDPSDTNVVEAVSDDRLWFPDNGAEPQLDAGALAALDMIADQIELTRLQQKGVIRPAADADPIWEMKSLSTKFVRTWRLKKRDGRLQYLRRSRLCAREFRWLDGSKEGLFSPATSSDIVRFLPALFLSYKFTHPDTEYCLLSMDIKDAYLQVYQPTPVVSKIQLGPGILGISFSRRWSQDREKDRSSGSCTSTNFCLSILQLHSAMFALQ